MSLSEAPGIIPHSHPGIAYEDFMAVLSAKRETRRYLEIGVHDGKLLARISAEVAVGVDPDFVIRHNIAAHKGRVSLVTTTSDVFFADADPIGLLGGAPDLVFLDGYHTCQYLLRDFMNAEKICNERSLIIMHDCLPLDAIMTIRYLEDWRIKTATSRFPQWWTGDVWKVIPILKKYRKDLDITYLDCFPTGLVCITNLSATDHTLDRAYMSIMQEFKSLADTEDALAALYGQIEMTPCSDVLRESDHSAFFRV